MAHGAAANLGPKCTTCKEQSPHSNCDGASLACSWWMNHLGRGPAYTQRIETRQLRRILLSNHLRATVKQGRDTEPQAKVVAYQRANWIRMTSRGGETTAGAGTTH